jgi:hypothetical protein
MKDGTMLKRVTGLAIAVTGIVGFMAAPAGAGGYPPGENGIAVGCTTPAPGDSVALTATGFTPGATVTVTLDPGPAALGSGPADGEGAFTLDATIPDDAAAGDHTITASGESADGLLSLTARVTVTAEGCEEPSEPAPGGAAPAGGQSSDGDGGGLAFTGSGLTVLLLQIALALAAIGGVFMALSKRRRHARASV